MSRGEAIGVLVGLFTLVGVAVGTVGATTTGWAEAAFATEAAGRATEFGPIFVAQLYLLTSATVVLAGPVMGTPLGTAFGMRATSTTEGAVVGGVGCGLGAFAMALVAVAIVVASKGAAAEQAHGFAAVFEPAAVGGLAAGGVGGVAGVVGSLMG